MSAAGRIVDDHPSCDVIADLGARELRIQATFVDREDASLKARVILTFAPTEAIDLIEQMVESLGQLGVAVKLKGQS